MAKIWIMSDMHCEFGVPTFAPKFQHPAEIDLVIIAGDYHHADRAVQHARQNLPEHRIVMVAGNHEHYNTRATIDDGINRMHAAANADRHANKTETYVLENENVE